MFPQMYSKSVRHGSVPDALVVVGGSSTVHMHTANYVGAASATWNGVAIIATFHF